MAVFTSRFGTGDTVYLRNREAKEPGIVIRVVFTAGGGHASYTVSWAAHRDLTDHFEVELSETHDPHYGSAE